MNVAVIVIITNYDLKRYNWIKLYNVIKFARAFFLLFQESNHNFKVIRNNVLLGLKQVATCC